jgi:hypothetical protein
VLISGRVNFAGLDYSSSSLKPVQIAKNNLYFAMYKVMINAYVTKYLG